MKILHITTMDNAGAGLCCIRIHQSLLAEGIESKVITLMKTSEEENVYEYGYIQIKIGRAFSKLLRIIGLQITDWNKLFKIKEKNHSDYTLPTSFVDVTKNELFSWADIIHLHWVNNYVDLPSFFRKVNKPVVWTLHDENLFYGIAHHHKNVLPGEPLEVKCREIKLKALKNAKDLSIVFLSQMMYRNFGDKEIIKGRRKTVINNSVNSKVFYPMDREEMRKKYGLESRKRYFVLISMNIADPNKGLDLLSDALSEVDPSAEIMAVGGNPWNRKWSNVKIMGLISNQREMCELISCADYLAMPSYQEAFSQSPLEAMACGLPVIVFPVSGTSELVNDRNGIICGEFTKGSLKEGILKLLSQKYNPEEIRHDVISRFSPHAIARKYIELYDEILKN